LLSLLSLKSGGDLHRLPDIPLLNEARRDTARYRAHGPQLHIPPPIALILELLAHRAGIQFIRVP
jgi:hypothetical protein